MLLYSLYQLIYGSTWFYFRYCQNMETAQHVLKNVGENHSVIQSCQRDLGHQLPLSSYLLKPVQRLTKYQLILKQLSECSPGMLQLKLDSILDSKYFCFCTPHSSKFKYFLMSSLICFIHPRWIVRKIWIGRKFGSYVRGH